MAGPIASALVKFGFSELVAGAIAQIGTGILLSAVSNLFVEKPKSPDAERDIAQPRSTPSKRFVYGVGQLAAGSPAPAWVTNDGYLYACYIMNSRPSDGIDQLVFDKRYVDIDGDILDFTGPGADVVHPQLAEHVRCWIGLGDQSGPPDLIMSEVGDATGTDATKFWPTDRWTGQTVIWGRFKKGGSRSQAERWPSAPPVFGAIGDWSKVWDPREAGQDADDPATWTVSNNAWLCILDCLRFNPLARWSLDQINIDSFIAAANDADATRARLGGGIEPRWRIGGTIYFAQNSVLLDVMLPMIAATGGDIMIDGEGLTAIPATTKTPVITVTDWMADAPCSFRARQRSRDLPKAVQATWRQPEAKWEEQTMQPVVVPGQTWLGGDDRVEAIDLGLVPFGGQVQHLQQIAARRKSLGRELSFTAGPEFFANGVQAGDWLTVNFGADYASRNGTYELRELQPGEWLGDDGVAFRQPVILREIAASALAWDPATDEMDIYVPPEVSEIDLSLAPPSAVTLEADEGTVTVTIEAATQNISLGVDYVAEYRPTAESDWRFIGTFPAPASTAEADVTVDVADLDPLTEYVFRVRSELPARASAYVEDTITTLDFTTIINGGTY